MYYKLHDHCKLVNGKARGAIYDLHSGKVYSINRSAAALLTEEAPDAEPENTPTRQRFFDMLTAKDLGGFYFTKPAAAEEKPRRGANAKLEFVWLELTARCNNRCLHCYTGSTSQEDGEKVLSLSRWKSLIGEIRAAGCDALQFIGGEPLLYPHWRELVGAARELGFGFIEVFTNATLLTDEDIDFLAAHNVHIATTIYAGSASIHDHVTQNQGSFAQTMRSIHRVLEKKLPLRIASILMKDNEDEGDAIMRLCGDLGVEVNPPDIIRPTGRGGNRALMPLRHHRDPIAPPFFIEETQFEFAKTHHPCLAGKIAVTTDGTVLPCVFARSRPLGSVLDAPLAEILQGAALLECWQTTKDKIKKCKDCEYRYACHDCRPLAQTMDESGDWLAAPAVCGYDPCAGVWDSAAVKPPASI